MLGRLARWMRIINCDTLYFNRIEDGQLAWIARQEGRIVLTRDTTLAVRKFIEKSVLISSVNTPEQLRQVVKKCSITVYEKDLLCRCVLCNIPICEVTKDFVQGKVPPFVFQAHTKFFYCEKCHRCYWQGSHYERIHEALGDLIVKKEK